MDNNMLKINKLRRPLLYFYIILGIMSTFNINGSFAYSSFLLTRGQQDEFENPTITKCNWEEKSQKFCKDKKAACTGGKQPCCSCRCEYGVSTFDKIGLKCRENKEFRAGCDLFFQNVYADSPLKLLDLSDDGDSKLSWNRLTKQDQLNCRIDSIVYFHNGASVGNKFIAVKSYTNEGYRRLITIEWDDDDVPKATYGEVLKANMTCEIKRRIRGKNVVTKESRCFVFKTAGKLTIYRGRSLSSTVQPVSKTSKPPKKSPTTTVLPKTPSSTVKLVSETPKRPNISPTITAKPSVHPQPSHKPKPPTKTTVLPKEVSAMASRPVSVTKTLPPTEHEQSVVVPPMTSIPTTSSEPDQGLNAQEQSDGEGNNTAIISSIVVICVLLVVAFVLYILWARKRSAALKQKPNVQGVSNPGARTTNNGMMMNDLENIYAEADVKNSTPVGKGDNVYDYAAGNHYASLDKNIPNEKNTYQSLTSVNKNMYESIPAQKSTKNGISSQPAAVSEPFYHTVEGGTTDNVYHAPDGSMYEAPVDQPSYDQGERVYGVLENDQHDTDPDYLVVLPEQ